MEAINRDDEPVPAMRETFMVEVVPWCSVTVTAYLPPYAQSVCVIVKLGCVWPCVRYGGM